MRLSIIVPTHDKLRYLAATLANLAMRRAESPTVDVVVVDDGSSDGTADHLAALVAGDARGWLRTVRTEHVGLAAARNAGVRIARGTHVFFVDDDVVIGRGCLAAMTRHIDAAPDAVHVGDLRNVRLASVSALLDEARAPSFRGFDTLDAHCEFHSMYEAAKVLFAGVPSATPAVWWAVITGGNLCVPRAALHGVGGFDESFAHWGPEDADLCYRLFRAGVRAAYHDDCRVFHLDHPRDAKAIRLAMMRNAGLLFKKHGKPPELLEYLRFFNGMTTLEQFNAATADVYALPRHRLPEFRLTMKDVTRQEHVIAWRSA